MQMTHLYWFLSKMRGVLNRKGFEKGKNYDRKL